MAQKRPKKRRLKKGRDFHGWAWKSTDSLFPGFYYYAEPYKPTRERHNELCPGIDGKWVRVKFVEVKP